MTWLFFNLSFKKKKKHTKTIVEEYKAFFFFFKVKGFKTLFVVDVLFFATKNNTFLDVLFSQFCYVIIILLNTYKRSFYIKTLFFG
jgi:hypothetical protein